MAAPAQISTNCSTSLIIADRNPPSITYSATVPAPTQMLNVMFHPSTVFITSAMANILTPLIRIVIRANEIADNPRAASGVLPSGVKFKGPAEFRAMLMTQRDQFVTTVTEKLLTYALGRGVEYYDAPAVRKIVRDAAKDRYRFSSIILGLVKSTPFQMRRSAS